MGEPERDGPAETAGHALVLTRLFDAPRAMVFRAWVDPAQAMRWMGPPDHPVCHIEGDVRPGGAWRAALRPVQGGRDLWQGGVYREIAPPERLVFTFAWDREDGQRGPETLVTLTFEDHGDRTLMTLHQAPFETAANRDGHRGGWTGTFDRLVELLAHGEA